ncbi:hypothetical protein BS47DRAFT_1408244 [Hydnum rufescens UP504]|uniref:Uncharacterized protein n=1 Tax=Hydnum rufescens UP504 TaxID=1448309 RepID=A0A9P6AR46_9AGAM|nr:hypothetical protein BS47DRAFT_1408244 [Hydnum rufescens UP504]
MNSRPERRPHARARMCVTRSWPALGQKDPPINQGLNTTRTCPTDLATEHTPAAAGVWFLYKTIRLNHQKQMEGNPNLSLFFLLRQPNDHTPPAAGVWSQGTTKTREMTRAQTATRHGNPTNGNTPSDVTHDNVPNDATHGNAPNDATHGNTPNEDATALNKGPRNHTPAMAGVWSYIRSSLLVPMNTDAKPPVTPPIDAQTTGPGGTRPNCRTYEPEYGPSTPHPLQRVWDPGQNPRERPTTNPRNDTPRTKPANDPPQTKTAGRTHTTRRTSRSTGPQYPAPAAAGVGYCKILNQNPHTPPTTNLLNDMLQTKTVNKPP